VAVSGSQETKHTFIIALSLKSSRCNGERVVELGQNVMKLWISRYDCIYNNIFVFVTKVSTVINWLYHINFIHGIARKPNRIKRLNSFKYAWERNGRLQDLNQFLRGVMLLKGFELPV
jgi:hypothetical protein